MLLLKDFFLSFQSNPSHNSQSFYGKLQWDSSPPWALRLVFFSSFSFCWAPYRLLYLPLFIFPAFQPLPNSKDTILGI